MAAVFMFSTSTVVIYTGIAQRWIAEGAGAGVTMCVPQ